MSDGDEQKVQPSMDGSIAVTGLSLPRSGSETRIQIGPCKASSQTEELCRVHSERLYMDLKNTYVPKT
jgi:hypothetical protein